MGIAISEPHAGSGATDIKSRARVDGDSIVLNGQKAYVEDVSHENAFLIYIKFDDRPGAKSIGGVIVEKDTPGFRIGPHRKKWGCAAASRRTSSSRTAVFRSRTRRPPASSSSWRPSISSASRRQCGNGSRHRRSRSRRGIEVRKRKQFGRLLCEFQGFNGTCRMAMQVDAARLLMLRAVSNAAQGFPSMIEASMAKAFANEITITVTNDALQVFGALGYLRECPLERMVRDARAWGIAGGTIELQLNNIASQPFGRRFNQWPEHLRRRDGKRLYKAKGGEQCYA